MPLINIKLTPEGLTKEVKEDLVKSFTNILVDKLGKNPKTTIVIIEEIPTNNWGISGKTVTSRRNKNGIN